MLKFTFLSKKNLYYLKKLDQQLKKSNISYYSFILPLFIFLAASLCEGATIILSIPVLDWMMKKDLGSIKNNDIFRQLVSHDAFAFLNNDKTLFIFLILGVFASAIGKNVLFLISAWGTAKQVRKVSNFLRKSIYSRYLSFGKLYFEKHSLGYLHQLITTYVDTVALEFRNLQGAGYALSTLLVYLIIMLMISVKLTLIVILVFPLLHKALNGVVKKLRDSSKSYAESYNILGRRISNALNCIPLIKAYSTEKKEIKDFNRTSDAVRDLQYSVDKHIAMIGPIQEIIMLSLIFTLIGIISYIASVENTGGIAKYFAFIGMLKRSSGLFGSLNTIRASLASLSGPLQEVMSVFDNELKYIIPDGEKNYVGLHEHIELRNLNFTYPGGNQVLNGVDFKIEKGTMTAIVGQSGSGKSTLINLLMRFYDCEPGNIYVDGTDIREFDLNSWLKGIALVSQEAFLFHATFRENLVYGLDREVSNEELNEVVKSSRLQDLLSKLPHGLDSDLGDKGMRLSGGEKQRISIARAILKKPDILILDEPTSALDSNTEKQIQVVIDQMFGDKTIIVIAHRLATVQHAEKIIVLEKGRVVEMGPPRQLLAQRGKFHSYWEAQHLTGVISQM